MKYMKYMIASIAVLSAIALGGLGIVMTGAFNVAATDPHSDLVQWVTHTTMRRSVAVRSAGITAPEGFTEAQARDGFNEFSAMCAGCHGAPGKMRGMAGKGLYPRPPDLAIVAPDWDNKSLFWIVKNGIKMTGMPAFGPTHDDQTIWNIVAFVRQLPNMTSDQYTRWEEENIATGHTHEH